MLSRRGLLIGSAALPTGCAVAERPIPGLSSEQVAPEGPVNLATGEGIAVGVAFFGRHNHTYLDSRLRSFIFDDPAGVRREISCRSSPRAKTVVSMDRGAELHLTPFAFKLPAGRSRVVGRAYKGEYRWELLRGPPMDFDVVAGRVTYIGRLGVLRQETEYGTVAGRDASCQSGSRSALLASRFYCSFQDFVFGSEPERDLPLIRANFPALAARDIETGPAARPGGGWRRWPEALRPKQDSA